MTTVPAVAPLVPEVTGRPLLPASETSRGVAGTGVGTARPGQLGTPLPAIPPST